MSDTAGGCAFIQEFRCDGHSVSSVEWEWAHKATIDLCQVAAVKLLDERNRAVAVLFAGTSYWETFNAGYDEFVALWLKSRGVIT